MNHEEKTTYKEETYIKQEGLTETPSTIAARRVS